MRRRCRGRSSGCCRRTRARSSCPPCTGPRIELIVQPAQRALLRRVGLVVLHEIHRDPGRLHLALRPALHEPAARITEHLRLQHIDSLEFRFRCFHDSNVSFIRNVTSLYHNPCTALITFSALEGKSITQDEFLLLVLHKSLYSPAHPQLARTSHGFGKA